MNEQSFLTEFDTLEVVDPTNYVDSFTEDWYGESGPGEPADYVDSYADEWYGEVGDITDSSEAYLEDGHVDFDEDVSMWGESLRGALSEEIAQTASPDEVDSLLDSVLDSLTPGESFNFGRALSSALPAVKAVLPAVAGTAGTALLPGVGTVIGTRLGSSLAGSLSRQPGPARTPAVPSVPTPAVPSLPTPAVPSLPTPAVPSVPTPGEPSLPTPAVPSVPTPGEPSLPTPAAPSVPTAAAPQTPAVAIQPAAMQAAAFVNHPLTQQALIAAALGELGKRMPNGVPVTAYLGAARELFGKAEQEADERMRTSADYPAYLLDADGRLRVDPAVPAERADALYDALMNQQTWTLDNRGELR